MLSRFRAHAQNKRAAYRLYAALVHVARAEPLYRTYGVPDTLDGRFDAIVLHLFLLQQRLKQDAPPEVLRYLSEALISDMDRSLREMGVGDMGVGKRVKKMGSALLGRVKAYEDAEDSESIAQALSRNVYRLEAPQMHPHAEMLAHYVGAAKDGLDRTPTATLLAGQLPAAVYPTTGSVAGDVVSGRWAEAR